MISKDLSGRAIAQLQAEGKKPIADLQKHFESKRKARVSPCTIL